MWSARLTSLATASLRPAAACAIPFLAACAAVPPERALSKPVAAARLEPGAFTAPGGESFGVRSWTPRQVAQGRAQPRAVVLAAHGLGGASSDFWPLGERLAREGYAVYAYELRGMGNDPEPWRRGTIRSRSDWLADFSAFARALENRWPDVPVVWYGESLGSVITLQMTRWRDEQELEPRAIVLAAPIVRTRGKLPPWKERLTLCLIRTLPCLRIPLTALGGEPAQEARVVSTTTHAAQLEKTPHALRCFSLRLLGEIGRLVESNRETAAPDLDLPVLIVYGAHDVFTPAEEVETFLDTVLPPDLDKTGRFFPESYHLLLHDVERGRVLDAISAWLAPRAR